VRKGFAHFVDTASTAGVLARLTVSVYSGTKDHFASDILSILPAEPAPGSKQSQA
jgi:hypothetical protein